MIKEINISDNGKTIEEAKPSIQPDVSVPEPIKSEKPKFNFKVLIFPIVAVLTLGGIGAFYYFGIYKLQSKPLNDVLAFNSDYISSQSGSGTFENSLALLSAPTEPRTEQSPLNGLLFTKTEMDVMKTRRPVVVMNDNHVDARPQSGINSADIVIEANAEGGITRLMEIYWSTAPAKVGPIRSMRQYFLEWASEYDPLVIHDGCASSTDVRINACGNLYSYGTKDLATIGAWRSSEGGTKVAPHNEFSSVTYAWEYAKKMNWDSFPTTIGAWKFKPDATLAERGEKTVVKAAFHTRLSNNGLYDVVWTYDKATNVYYRKVGGQISVDAETNTQIYAKNIVVQAVSMVSSGDSKGHLIITTIGQGDATYLIDGKITHGTWKKTSRTSRTTYYDSAGKEIEFNRGRIWVEMVSTSYGKFDIIEQ